MGLQLAAALSKCAASNIGRQIPHHLESRRASELSADQILAHFGSFSRAATNSR